MLLKNHIDALFAESTMVRCTSQKAAVPVLYEAFQILDKCFRDGGKVLTCGNGGSACDASHIASELVNRFVRERKAYPCIALTTDPAVMTSIANDRHYAEVFSRQIDALGKPGDVLIAITTSGNSENVQEAIATALAIGMKVIILTGNETPAIDDLVDIENVLFLRVVSSKTQHIQETHLLYIHIICQLIDEYSKN